MPTHTLDEWQTLREGVSLRTQPFIAGEAVETAARRTYQCVNPASGENLVDVALCDEEDVDRAVRSSRDAFETGVWANAAPADRKETLLKLADLIRRDADELALCESLDMGKPVEDAAGVDIPGAAGTFQWYAEAADKLYDEIAPTASDDIALITREPLGVVAAITAWNFPLDLASWKLGPALVAGNSVVLKPPSQAPHSALKLAELATEAGVPDGILNVVTGSGQIVGRALGLHTDVDCIAFTGSNEVGLSLLGYSAQSNGKPVWLELGGKSPNLVFADADDLDRAADMAAFGIFFNQGEVCSANSRLLVEQSVRDQFVELVTERAEAITVGDPLDPATKMGPLIDEKATETVLDYIEQGRRTGKVRTGGERVSVNGYDRCFVAPTIIEQLPNTHRVAQEEIFGPVLTVHDFADEDEAVRIANETRFGLAASIWTNNLQRAHRVSRRLRAGTVSVNTVDALSPQTPFGGFKHSGFGRDLSLHAIDKYSGLKTTWIKL